MALGLIGGVIVPAGPAAADEATAAADPSACMPLDVANPLDQFGGDHPGPNFTDNNPTLYVRGNLDLQNHEGEGLVLVEGDMDVTLGYWGYWLGRNVAGGTGAWPEVGALMLGVHGDLTVHRWPVNAGDWTTLNIGNDQNPGAWSVDGAITVPTGAVVQTPGYRDTRTAFDQLGFAGTTAGEYSADVDQLNGILESLSTSPNGTVQATQRGGEVGLTLTGDGASGIQIFDVDYATYEDVLRGAIRDRDVHARIVFDQIPDDASIILNVDGQGPIQLPGDFRYTLNGVDVPTPQEPYGTWKDQDLEAWGQLTQRLMWRFPTAADITLGTEDYDIEHGQWTGSLMAVNPASQLRTYSSTNGRVIAFGGFTMFRGDTNPVDDNGAPILDDQGNPVEHLNEFHSFPFRMGILDCPSTPNPVGTFSVQKTTELIGLQPGDVTLPATVDVTATWTQDGREVSEVLAVPVDGAPVPSAHADIPLGTVVHFEEGATPAIDGVTHAARISPPDVIIGGGIGNVGGDAAVVITNTYTKTPVGGLTIAKRLDGVPAGSGSIEFTGAYACTLDGSTVASGAWSVTGAGDAVLAADDGMPAPGSIPAGAVCAVTENRPGAAEGLPGAWTWGTATITPGQGVIVADEVLSVVVTNTAEPAPPLPPGDLASTGANPAALLAGATTIALIGLALLLASRLPGRRRSA